MSEKKVYSFKLETKLKIYLGVGPPSASYLLFKTSWRGSRGCPASPDPCRCPEDPGREMSTRKRLPAVDTNNIWASFRGGCRPPDPPNTEVIQRIICCRNAVLCWGGPPPPGMPKNMVLSTVINAWIPRQSLELSRM